MGIVNIRDEIRATQRRRFVAGSTPLSQNVMPIVGYGPVLAQDTISNSNPSTIGQVVLPTGLQAGDIMILCIWAFAYTSTFTAPTGWTAGQAPSSNGGTTGTSGTATIVGTFVRTYVPGDTNPSVVLTSSAGRGAKAFIIAFRPQVTGGTPTITYGISGTLGGLSSNSATFASSDFTQMVRVVRFIGFTNNASTTAPFAPSTRPAFVATSGVGAQVVTPSGLPDTIPAVGGSGGVIEGTNSALWYGTSASGSWTWPGAVNASGLTISIRENPANSGGEYVPNTVSVPAGVGSTTGAWVELITSAPFEAKMLRLIHSPIVPITSTDRYYIDIGVGPAGAEIVVASQIEYFPAVTYNGSAIVPIPEIREIPIAVPVGTRVAIRAFYRLAGTSGATTTGTYGAYAELLD